MDNKIILHPDTSFFQIAMRIIRSHFNNFTTERSEKTILVNNAGKDSGTYKFIVEWQDELQSGIEIFRIA